MNSFSRLLPLGVALAMFAYPSAAKDPPREADKPAPSPAEIAILDEFWKAIESPEVKTLGDVSKCAYGFGKKSQPDFLNVIFKDLGSQQSLSHAAETNSQAVRQDRYGSFVDAQIYGPNEKQALEILEWWKKNGDYSQSAAAETWLKTHAKMRLVEHGDEYDLKYRVWPNLKIESKEMGMDVRGWLEMLETKLPQFGFFAGRSCKAYRIALRGDDDPALIDGYQIANGPVAVEIGVAASIAKKLCDVENLGGRTMCIFDPGLLLRFEGKGSPVDVVICFKCGDMLILRDGKNLCGRMLRFSPTLRRDFLKVGRQVAPDDEVWKKKRN